MEKFNSIDDILEFALEKEEESYQFYKRWKDALGKKGMARVFEEFAEEELKHRDFLLAIRTKEMEKLGESMKEEVQDLKIGDYLVDINPESADDYQDALILAMKREKASFNLYTNLAERTEDENLRKAFLTLAQQEANHKLRLEMEYDEYILTGN